jgi:hypothetical protein
MKSLTDRPEGQANPTQNGTSHGRPYGKRRAGASAVLNVQRIGHNAEALEVIEIVRLHALQAGLCSFQVVRFDAKGE